MDCPVLNSRVTLSIVYEVGGTDSCQIISNVVSVSCSQESACDRVSSVKCLVNLDTWKDYTI